jgi:hypothetical protein
MNDGNDVTATYRCHGNDDSALLRLRNGSDNGSLLLSTNLNRLCLGWRGLYCVWLLLLK